VTHLHRCEERMRASPVAVLAGTYAQFLSWQRENPGVRAVFCDQWPDFAGMEFSRVVEVGTFRGRKDAFELWRRVASRMER
jgi:hypothetical protein